MRMSTETQRELWSHLIKIVVAESHTAWSCDSSTSLARKYVSLDKHLCCPSELSTSGFVFRPFNTFCPQIFQLLAHWLYVNNPYYSFTDSTAKIGVEPLQGQFCIWQKNSEHTANILGTGRAVINYKYVHLVSQWAEMLQGKFYGTDTSKEHGK